MSNSTVDYPVIFTLANNVKNKHINMDIYDLPGKYVYPQLSSTNSVSSTDSAQQSIHMKPVLLDKSASINLDNLNPEDHLKIWNRTTCVVSTTNQFVDTDVSCHQKNLDYVMDHSISNNSVMNHSSVQITV
jgi:hypothetical protein